MIVRVLGEGQWRVPDERRAELNDIDDELVRVFERGDEHRFEELLHRLIDVATAAGERVADEELVTSDLMLPPRSTTIEEARELFSGEGVISV